MARRTLDDVIPLHLTTVTFPENHPLRGQTGDVFGFAVRVPEGVLLFDTGVGTGNRLVDEHYKPVHRPLASALAARGLQLADVVAIANSHLHFDHCGNNPLFAGVPIYMQRPELEATKERWYTVPAWVDFPGAEHRVIDGGTDLGAGVEIVTTPGHTAGHQSLVVETTAGTVVLAGQAIYSSAECAFIAATGELPADADVTGDRDQCLVSARSLLVHRPRRVHFSHDAEVWEP